MMVDSSRPSCGAPDAKRSLREVPAGQLSGVDGDLAGHSLDRYDGVRVAELAHAAGAAALYCFASLTSTQDVAHALASAGAPAGTVVLADHQQSGRGRQGRRWESSAGAGVWMSVVERPTDAAALQVLSLRLGLAAAAALEPFAGGPVQVKWPNDLYLPAGKLAGILVEARWRDAQPEWTVIGIGVNVAHAGTVGGSALEPGTGRAAVVAALLPALRAAARRAGPLAPDEQAAWSERDVSVQRRVIAPEAGSVQGIDADGALRVLGDDGVVRLVRGGSLIFEDG